MNKVKVGVVGLGRIGTLLDEKEFWGYKPYTHLGGYLAVPECEVVAITDTDFGKAWSVGTKYGIFNVFENAREMIQKCPVDLVSVCTPTENHLDVVMDVAPYVKAIFCEKPITDSIKTAKKLVETCKRYGVILAVNQTRRWNPVWQEVKQRIDRGEIGKLLYAVGYFSGSYLRCGVHMFDLMNWYKPESYRCIPCGTPYLIFELDLIGTDGRIKVLENGRRVVKQSIYESSHYQGLKELDAGIVDYPYKDANPMINAVKDIVSCIQKGGQPKCTGEDGLKALELTLAMVKK